MAQIPEVWRYFAKSERGAIPMRPVYELPAPRFVSPIQIKEYLDRFIIGQEDAKRGISLAAAQRSLRLMSQDPYVQEEKGYVPLSKSNILLLGPTGCGKTLLVQKLGEIIDAAVHIADCSQISETAYVGKSVVTILGGLVDAAFEKACKWAQSVQHPTDSELFYSYLREQIEHGVVYLDEFDKLANTENDRSTVTTLSVQEEMLKFIEGSNVNIGSGGAWSREEIGSHFISNKMIDLNVLGNYINTENILFIAGGSFSGLSDIITARSKGNTMGFTAHVTNSKEELDVSDQVLKDVQTDDLVKFGLIPEVVGRFGLLIALQSLQVEDLTNILVHSENSLLRQLQYQYRLLDKEIEFSNEAIIKVATLARDMKTGARGLKTIIDRSLKDVHYDAFNYDGSEWVHVDEDKIN